MGEGWVPTALRPPARSALSPRLRETERRRIALIGLIEEILTGDTRLAAVADGECLHRGRIGETSA